MANYLTSEAARNENESKVKQAGMVDFFENGLQNQLSKAEVYEHYFSACKGRGKLDIQTVLQLSTVPNLVGMKDKNGQSGMSWACAFNNLTAVKTLAEYDQVDLNAPDNDGNTPLMMAAQAGHDKIVRYFVFHMRRHVLIDAENQSGFTALMKAALNGKSNCARMLIIAEIGGTTNATAQARSHAWPTGNRTKRFRSRDKRADVTKRDWGKGLRADEWASLCGMHETAIVIRNVAKCALTEEQKQELNWEKKKHPVVEFFTSAGRYLRRAVGWEGERWMVEAGSLYYLASHAASVQSSLIANKANEGSYSNQPRSNNGVESATYCISKSNHGEDSLRIETTYENDERRNPTRQTITQQLFDKPVHAQNGSNQKQLTISIPKQVPDVKLTTASPVKQMKRQPKKKIDRNLLVVPSKPKKKRCLD